MVEREREGWGWSANFYCLLCPFSPHLSPPPSFYLLLSLLLVHIISSPTSPRNPHPPSLSIPSLSIPSLSKCIHSRLELFIHVAARIDLAGEEEAVGFEGNVVWLEVTIHRSMVAFQSAIVPPRSWWLAVTSLCTHRSWHSDFGPGFIPPNYRFR